MHLKLFVNASLITGPLLLYLCRVFCQQLREMPRFDEPWLGLDVLTYNKLQLAINLVDKISWRLWRHLYVTVYAVTSPLPLSQLFNRRYLRQSLFHFPRYRLQYSISCAYPFCPRVFVASVPLTIISDADWRLIEWWQVSRHVRSAWMRSNWAKTG